VEASALRAPAGLTRLALPSALLRLRSDEQLVQLFRAGNDDAFGIIHDRYRARLFAYTRQMLGGSRADAEDAMQDVFLRAYNALRVDSRPVALKAWLYRVAHNRCIDHLRRPVPPPNEIFELSRTPMPDPMAEAERRDDLRRLVADVQRLPEQQRSALLMREMEGLSYADLAEALDVSVPAVKSLLVRARIGLTEAAEARDTACCEIRDDLALSFGKGVRASAKARKHMRECDGCRDYRTQLRAVQQGLGALNPGSHVGLLAKLLGIGGAGGAAGGGAAAGGSAIVAGGGVVTATTAKVAAIVCCATIVTGGAVELRDKAMTGTAPVGSSKSTSSGSSSSVAPALSDKVTAPSTLRDATAPVKAEAAQAREQLAARKAAALSAATATEQEAIGAHLDHEDVVAAPAAEPTQTQDASGGALAPPAEEPSTGASGGSSSGATAGEPTASSGQPTATATTAVTPSGPTVAEAEPATNEPETEIAAGPGGAAAPPNK
jgi:RNA polymerase sigma factor (sigma-70 family)